MRRILGVVCAVAAIGCTVSASASFQQQTPAAEAPAMANDPNAGLPAGPGRDTFVRVCSACHLTSVATTQQKTAEGWTDIVVDMRGRGAQASDDEAVQIVEYLAANFGPKPATPPSK